MPGIPFIRHYGIIFHTVNQGQVVSRRDFLLISQNIFQIFVYYSALPRPASGCHPLELGLYWNQLENKRKRSVTIWIP